jgi:hypothetical protein
MPTSILHYSPHGDAVTPPVEGQDQSVEQIERFYAKHLPLSREMAKNLQSFGE